MQFKFSLTPQKLRKFPMRTSVNLLDRRQVLYSGGYTVDHTFIGTERNTYLH